MSVVPLMIECGAGDPSLHGIPVLVDSRVATWQLQRRCPSCVRVSGEGHVCDRCDDDRYVTYYTSPVSA